MQGTNNLRYLALVPLIFIELVTASTYVDVYVNENANLDFNFAQNSSAPFSTVMWSFLPFNTPTSRKPFILTTDTADSRFKSSIYQVPCSDDLANYTNDLCQMARLTIENVFEADVGTYFAQVKGHGCSPCSGEFTLVASDDIASREILNGDNDDSIGYGGVGEPPLYFYAPPFTIDFNVNSSVCLGQSFEFLCAAEPPNFGINLTLYRLDPLFTVPKLRNISADPFGIDFRNSSTKALKTFASSDVAPFHLAYKLDAVTENDTGGYLCVGSVPNMPAARWSYMHLNVLSCADLKGRSIHDRVMEVFASPTALTFICLLLAILLITLATLIIFSCRRKQLPLFLLGPKKWSKAATKVVRETNLLYPWASPPHHNCSHLQTKEAMNAAASALFGNRTPGVGRNLQVPAVIIQVNNATTTASENGTGVQNNNGGVRCESKPNTYKIPSDPVWEVARDCIRLGRQIGAGAFGVVYAGVVADPTKVLPGLRRRDPNDRLDVQELTVAVKTLRDNFTEQELADLVREMEILKQFDPHPHVIQLYGACTQNGRLQVLVELAPYGNLRDFLMDRRPHASKKSIDQPMSRLSTHHLVSFGLQVAQGMDYLTRLNIVHRDLAARNILIGDRFVAKIADFGLTRAACDYYRKCSDGRLPIKWMAPESIFDRRYTAKSDVWSFGILLWEIFSFGGTPYPTLSAEALLKALQLGFRNEQPVASPNAVYNLMLTCWSIDPNARPSFAHLVAALQQVYDDATNAAANMHAFLSLSASSLTSLDSSSSSNASSRSSSPTVSTVYLTLNNANNTMVSTSINRNHNDQGTGMYRSTEQWPVSSVSEEFQDQMESQGQTENNVLMNNCYADSGQYLQSVHKAFSMHFNYVMPPRSAEHSDYVGPQS